MDVFIYAIRSSAGDLVKEVYSSLDLAINKAKFDGFSEN